MSQRVSLWIEVVSAIAVVVSLVFVGLEIRNSSEQVEQNTEMMQISAYQDLIERIVQMNAIAIEQGASIENLLERDDKSPEDVLRLNNYLWIIFRHGDMAYFQYEKGAIDKERLRSANAPLLERLRYPEVQVRWRQVEQVFVPQYREYMSDQIAEINGG
ncbi:hypothetical protein [Congregibacter sp.]|uniref:hypothetical protein n=1 Tax=Congregibacter sp. TaxID=2744308 RepID=UPI00385FBBB5